MSRFVFKLPDVGEGTAEAEIVAWHVAVGEHVNEDQQLVDVMTDKATVEMTSPVSGTVVALMGKPGEMAPVGAPLVEFEIAGETVAEKTEVDPSPVPPPAVGPEPAAAGHKPLASPALRARAAERGVELAQVPGTGPGGRITQDDLGAYLAGASGEEVDEVKLIGLRRRIAEKMQEAKRRIPHFAYVEEIDMTELEALRQRLNSGKKPEQPKLTVLPFIMRSLVRALPDFPQVNAHFDDEAGVLRRFKAVHIGIATQTDAGLMVPVVRNAQNLDLWGAAAEVARLAATARGNKASKEELSGSTITVTSLGAMGGVASTPIINRQETAIIGPNAIRERVVVREGAVVVRKMMNLSSSFDHRVVDGADAAAFVQRLKTLLENPAGLAE
jgi:2-oxoisovalerate dehydrogenase E2 component (dihydrolipoyl transacylase)